MTLITPLRTAELSRSETGILAYFRLADLKDRHQHETCVRLLQTWQIFSTQCVRISEVLLICEIAKYQMK